MSIRMLSLIFVAAALWVLPQAAGAEVFDGTIMNVSEGELVLLVAEEELTFAIDDETTMTLDGAAVDDLMDLEMGATASVTAEQQEDDSWLATSVVAQSAPLVPQE